MPLTITSAGDVLTHGAILDAARTPDGAYDFTTLLGALPALLEPSDVAIYNQEMPLTRTLGDVECGDQDDGHRFRAPAALAEALAAAGFNACSTANNHTWDAGHHGVTETRTVLADAGILPVGPNPNDPPEHIQLFRMAGFTVALASYTYTLDNRPLGDVAPPDDGEWAAYNLWPLRGYEGEGIIGDAQAARAAGADIVCVSLHWGVEYTRESASQRYLARALLESGEIDWIMGNHPHVHQSAERINGRYVTYSQGNLMSGRDTSTRPMFPVDTSLMTMTFERDGSGQVTRTLRCQPLLLRPDTHTLELATPTLNAGTWWNVARVVTALGLDESVMVRPASSRTVPATSATALPRL